MPAKPTNTPCSVPGCKAWAMRGSEPPLCSAHAGRTAPQGNQYARKHGFYSSVLDVSELADLVACADDVSLDDEIACTRVVLRRLLELLRTLPEDTDPADYARLAGLALQAARTVARLLRDKRALGGDAADGIAGAIAQALDELSTEWGIEL